MKRALLFCAWFAAGTANASPLSGLAGASERAALAKNQHTITVSDWESALDAATLGAWSIRPQLGEQVWAAEPVLTRAGSLRIIVPELLVPEASPILLERALHDQTLSVPARLALIEGAARSGPTWADSASGILLSDQDPQIKRLVVELLGHLPEPHPALSSAATHPLAEIRAAALRAIAAQSNPGNYSVEIAAGLADSHAEVRIAAVKAATTHPIPAMEAAITSLLADPVAEVRLITLRGLARLRPDQIARLSEALLADPDPRVRSLASRLQ
jgi:hypothetical protein